jgi:hypothetical protein
MQTGQPYAFTDDDPLNSTDPLGLRGAGHLTPAAACSGFRGAAHSHCIKVRKAQDKCGTLGCGITHFHFTWSDRLTAISLFAAPILEGVGALAGGSSSEVPSVTSRVADLHGELDPIATNMRTSAVLRTQEGTDILASGGQDLTPAQRALAGNNDILGKLAGAHAEITALDAASKAGLTPSEMAVSRLICPACQAAIESSGGSVTPGGTGALWP